MSQWLQPYLLINPVVSKCKLLKIWQERIITRRATYDWFSNGSILVKPGTYILFSDNCIFIFVSEKSMDRVKGVFIPLHLLYPITTSTYYPNERCEKKKHVNPFQLNVAFDKWFAMTNFFKKCNTGLKWVNNECTTQWNSLWRIILLLMPYETNNGNKFFCIAAELNFHAHEKILLLLKKNWWLTFFIWCCSFC